MIYYPMRKFVEFKMTKDQNYKTKAFHYCNKKQW